ncbi:MAG: flagellar hook protein FlgE [Pseudomonadota bacterium]
MSFQQGLSGLNVASKSLDVIGNNVANAGVAGFKGATAQFGDVFASSLGGGGSTAIGIGAQLQAVAQQFSQGNITSTNNPMDIAINGNGFFRMSDNGNISYSRNGQFHADKNGNIINTNGNILTGYAADASGNILATAPVPLVVSSAALAPNDTGLFVVGMNLDAAATAKNALAFNTAVPSTFNNSTSGTVFDSIGGQHTLTLYFLKDSANSTGAAPTAFASPANDVVAGALTINGSAVGAITAGGSAALQGAAVAAAINLAAISGVTATATAGGLVTVRSTVGSLTVAFPGASATTANTGLTAGTTSAAGNWIAYATVDGAVTGGGAPVGVTLNGNAAGSTPLAFTNGGALSTLMPLTVSVDLNAVAAAQSPAVTNAAATPLAFTLDFTGSTQYGNPFSVTKLTQDGYASGRLSSIGIGGDGILVGHYSNGQTQSLGQVVLASFANPNGLSSEGANQWKDNSESGLPIIGVPGTGILGSLQASAIEDSNVDLTSQLVAMITAQRIYQANAQSIKTQDSVLQTLVNLR